MNEKKEYIGYKWNLRSMFVVLAFAAVCCGWWRDRRELNGLGQIRETISSYPNSAVTVKRLRNNSVVLSGSGATVDDVAAAVAFAEQKYAKVINNLSVNTASLAD